MEERIFKERIFLTPVEIRKRRGDFFLVRHEGTMCYLINIFFSSNMFVQGNEDLVRHEGTMCYLVQGNEDGPALFGLLQVAPSSRLVNSLTLSVPFVLSTAWLSRISTSPVELQLYRSTTSLSLSMANTTLKSW